jgi:hypothetical protein
MCKTCDDLLDIVWSWESCFQTFLEKGEHHSEAGRGFEAYLQTAISKLRNHQTQCTETVYDDSYLVPAD